MGLDYFASSPIIGVQPQLTPHYPDNPSRSATPPNYRQLKIPNRPLHLRQLGRPKMSQYRPAAFTSAGRKRSRDEISSLDDTPGSFINNDPIASPKSLFEPSDGSGSSIIHPHKPDLNILAGSTTSAWAEEKLESQQQVASDEAANPAARPSPVSRKSQRLCTAPDSGEVSPQRNDINDLTGVQASLTSYVQDASIDEASILLGVGWTKVTGDAAKEAAARGWARYITNHFPMQGVELLLQSKSDGSYLVKAFIDREERYCRFTEDLQQYQLLAAAPGVPVDNAQAALLCIQQSPMQLLDTTFTHVTRSDLQTQPVSAEPIGNVSMDGGDAMVM
jgi:hypothetical protein